MQRCFPDFCYEGTATFLYILTSPLRFPGHALNNPLSFAEAKIIVCSLPLSVLNIKKQL